MNKTELEERINELEIELSNLKSQASAGKESEQNFKGNIDRFLSLSNTINGSFALINLDTLRYEFVNDSYDKSTGISGEKIIGSAIREVMGETNYQFALKHIDQIRLGKSVSFERCDEDGAEKRWSETNYAPVKDASGRITSFSVYNFDITGRKKTEHDLKESEEKYRNLFNNSEVGMFRTKLDGSEIVEFNKQYLKILGCTTDEVKGKPSKTMWANEHLREKMIQMIEKEGRVVDFECEILNKQGDVVNCITSLKLYPEIGILEGTIQDITERKQNEKIQSIQNRLSKIFLLHTDIGMYNDVLDVLLEVMESPFGFMGYIDVDGAYVMPTLTSQIWEDCKMPNQALVFPRNEWKNSTWACALREKKTLYSNEPSTNLPEGHAKIQRHISHPILFKGESIGLIQVANKETDYTERDLHTLERISDYVAPILYSILERIQAEKELKESETKLHRLNKDKDRFISILSHDLKNPFNALLGFSEILTQNIGQYRNEEIEEYAKIIHVSARHTYSLLEDILRWANAQAGKIDYKPKKLNFSEIYENVVYTLAPNAKAKNITIEACEPCPVTLFADLDMINLVFRNLVSNAIKFTHKGGRIEVSAKADPENIILCVSDNGIGIKPDHLEKFFDISQVFTTTGTANETGTGLGLILCKEFVEKHGGTIHVESEWGKGSKFFIHLPFADQANVV